MVMAAVAGTSLGAVVTASAGLFIEPLSGEFGWSRAEISLGLSIYALVAVPFSPFVGALIDRWGSRRLAIPGVVLTATAFSAFSLANGSTAQWLGLWLFYAFVALAIKTTVWTAAVSSTFHSGRGLALGLVLSGSALSQTLAPVIAQTLIDNHGWRSAYLWMGLGWGGLTLALILLFFFDANDRKRRVEPRADVAAARAALPGLTLAEACRDSSLLRIAAATLIMSFVLSAMTIHQVPLLTGKGITRESAALMAASAGLFAILGKTLTGWMLDRSTSGWIPGASLAIASVACLLLLTPAPLLIPHLVAVSLLGYCNGAHVQVSTYLTSRYGGMRNFGKIFGIIFSVMSLSVGIGPVTAGAVFDHSGSYVLILLVGIPATLASGLLVASLKPYPDWTK
jgi:MFS family permease